MSRCGTQDGVCFGCSIFSGSSSSSSICFTVSPTGSFEAPGNGGGCDLGSGEATDLSANRNQEQKFSWDVPGCASKSTIEMSGGTGDDVISGGDENDLLAIAATEGSDKGELELVEQLVMSPPAFLRMVKALGDSVRSLQDKGIISAAQQENNEVTGKVASPNFG